MQVRKPTLLVDQEKCFQNMDRMLAKANKANGTFRPHFKTHFSAEIGDWYRSRDIRQCTVSSVDMAMYFKNHGWEDITIAFPYNPLQIEEMNELSQSIQLNILIESVESLEHAKKNIEGRIGYFIKTDVGYHRTGVDPRNETLIADLVNASTDQCSFRGFLAHAGHTYGCKDFESVKWIFDKSTKILSALKEKHGGIISYGDTPSCSMMDDLSAFDEIRPGNFIFYDWMQKNIGSCNVEDIAVCLAVPVVAKHADRNEIVVLGGAVHLSKDRVVETDVMRREQPCFGKMVQLTGQGWDNETLGHVSRLSQEHGIIKMADEHFAHVKVGDLIGILPVHSCLTADLQPKYISVTDGKRNDKMPKA